MVQYLSGVAFMKLCRPLGAYPREFAVIIMIGGNFKLALEYDD